MVLLLILLGLVHRRRVRSLGVLAPSLTGFFRVDSVMAVTTGAVRPLFAPATATSVTPPALFHPKGICATPSAVPPMTRAEARPATPWAPVASETGALGAVSNNW
jgi:hypothetical protein